MTQAQPQSHPSSRQCSADSRPADRASPRSCKGFAGDVARFRGDSSLCTSSCGGRGRLRCSLGMQGCLLCTECACMLPQAWSMHEAMTGSKPLALKNAGDGDTEDAAPAE
eukprot:2562169-Pleurochrysis_carterae.AAC.1